MRGVLLVVLTTGCSVTADGSTLYFVRDADIYVAARTFAGFGSAAIDPELSSTSNDGKLSLLSDGLSRFFSPTRAGARHRESCGRRGEPTPEQ
jgi:hypothetical protein